MTLLQHAMLKPTERVKPSNIKAVPELAALKTDRTSVLTYCKEHEAELSTLSESALDYLGRLCCHASALPSIVKNPIIGDVHVTANQLRDSELFGNGEDLEPTYRSLTGVTSEA